MRSIILAAVVAATVPFAASAQSYRAQNELFVVPLNQTSFEVIEARGEGPRGMWCAAADFAKQRLGAKKRVYIQQGRALSQSSAGRHSVIFTTDAAKLSQGPFKSVTLSTDQVGVGLPVAHAIQFCRKDEYELADRLLRKF